MKQGKLGILGGMGPQATLNFYQRLVDHTAAVTDQEHIPTLILSDTLMPDRSAALLSGELQPVRDRMLAGCLTLEAWGASCIGITCNTAHAFVPEVQRKLRTPIVNMVTETAAELRRRGARTVGLLGTDGTLQTGLYHRACEAQGIQVVTPTPELQRNIMHLIFDQIKAGQRGDWDVFAPVDTYIREQGCDHAILACTELSVFGEWHQLPPFYLDAMDVLVRRCIEVCGYPLKDHT